MLGVLKSYSPLILCLDDLELFWSFSALRDKAEKIKDFFACIESWRKENEKGRYLYNFGNYINSFFQTKNKELNSEYLKFFSFTKLLKHLS